MKFLDKLHGSRACFFLKKKRNQKLLIIKENTPSLPWPGLSSNGHISDNDHVMGKALRQMSKASLSRKSAGHPPMQEDFSPQIKPSLVFHNDTTDF